MVNVIKNGDPDASIDFNYPKRYACNKCHCVFITTDYIVREHSGSNTYRSITVCPWCGNEIEEEI